MATWIGAIIDGASPEALTAAAGRYRLKLHREAAPRIFVESEIVPGSLELPMFAEPLSEELGCSVIAFRIQTTASFMELRQWSSGRSVRHLLYSADEGGWLSREGEPQPWEAAYFFAPDEGTREGQEWPFNLMSDLTDEACARYERARDARDPSRVMDLLEGVSTEAVGHLCQDFGLDPHEPGATYRPPGSLASWFDGTWMQVRMRMQIARARLRLR